MRRSILLSTAMLCSIGPSAAKAECPSGQRDTTPAESAALERLVVALPAAFGAPEGWRAHRERKPKVRKTTCLDPGGEQISSMYRVSFLEMAGAKARAAKVDALARSLSEPSKVDMATRFQEVADQTQQLQRDTVIKVSVRINERARDAKGEAVTVPGGYPAFQSQGDKKLPGQKKTVLLLGSWKRGDDGRMHAGFGADAATSVVHSIVVVVEAEAKRTQAYLGQADLGALGKLVGK